MCIYLLTLLIRKYESILIFFLCVFIYVPYLYNFDKINTAEGWRLEWEIELSKSRKLPKSCQSKLNDEEIEMESVFQQVVIEFRVQKRLRWTSFDGRLNSQPFFPRVE